MWASRLLVFVSSVREDGHVVISMSRPGSDPVPSDKLDDAYQTWLLEYFKCVTMQANHKMWPKKIIRML